MSSDKEIGAPYTLASLSKPVSSTNGRIHATGVCSISGIRKRKRTEIVVGVEGECISIYSLQNPQLVTSYALPPSASFTAAPYSTYRKGSSKTPAQRFTYASVTESTAGAKSQLVCFHETILGDNAETAKTSYTPSNGSQVSTIESLPVAGGGSSKDSTHDVLATFENGDVVCLSADLSTVRWVANLLSVGSQKNKDFKIENVTLSTARNVTRGLLRSREDIAALLSPESNAASDLLELTQILCVIGQNASGTRILQLLQVQPRNADLPSAQLQPLKHLLSLGLPKPSSILLRTDSVATYSLHATSGALHILVDGGIISYDLSGTVPKINSELLLTEAKIDSFLRISQDIVFATAPGSCRAFDVKYNSLQAHLALGAAPGPDDAASPRKRKHAQPEAETTATPQLVAYYAELGLVVAVRDDELLGMQYAGTNARKRVKTEGTLLIDALGKGIAKPKAGAESAKWLDRKEKLDRYASKSKIAKFEGVLASCLGIPLEKKTDAQTKQENEVKGGPLTNGVGPKITEEDATAVDKADEETSDDQLRKWNLPSAIPESQRQLHRQHALYALSKIFRFEGSTLKVAFFPPNVFQWLLQIGHLTKESIRRALLDEAPEFAHAVPKITDGDIVKAIVAFDLELHILSAVLNHKHFLPIGEVVEAIRLLTQSLDDKPETSETAKLLTNGAAPADEDMDVDTELDAATTEVDHALTVLSNGVSIRSNTLRPALTRLHTFPAPLISSTLRSVLPRRDLESLIRLLHSELKNGGWSSQYDFIDPEASTDDSPDDHAVTIIASLLSSTLDAIGAGAWLAAVGTPSSTSDGKDIIDALHADTSEALNGFWEARYMRGLLGEFLRYAANTPKSQKPSTKSLENQNKPFAPQQQKDGTDLPMLPLGGRPDMGVEKTKQGKGGRREERSKREIGMLISKKVPKYSFERIVV
ncbi:hypothetical protein N0V95_009218 [Ascochyta clinopodiicola]|nr:hypothetical protein N0V95_009218 [Ascochyta clinopodiicola]